MSEALFHGVIPGRVAIKKNKNRFSTEYRRYQQWERNAAVELWKQAPKDFKMIIEPVQINLSFHFKNRQAQADIDNCLAGPFDALVKAQIIKNDKLIHRIYNAEIIFGVEPCTLITLRRLKEVAC